MKTRERERSQELEAIRMEIDCVDRSLIDLISERIALARRTSEAKDRLGMDRVDPIREAEVIRQAAESARQEGLDPEIIRDVFWRLIALSRRVSHQCKPGRR